MPLVTAAKLHAAAACVTKLTSHSPVPLAALRLATGVSAVSPSASSLGAYEGG